MFRAGLMNNFQLQLVKDQQAVPLTRDYIHEQEERLRRKDQKYRHLTPLPPPRRRA